jgi:hypothetical protein
MGTNEAIKDLQELEFSRHRRIWKPFMEKYNCNIIAEIGVFEGENFRRMIEHRPVFAVAVDAWLDDGVVSRNDSGYSQEKLDEIYEKFCNEMLNKIYVQIHRGYTYDVAAIYPDNYFDLIYIDGDHTEEGCYKDLVAWYPKVRKGGFITGDDYWRNKAPRTGIKFGVIEAVDKFAKEKGLIIHKLPGHGWAAIK